MAGIFGACGNGTRGNGIHGNESRGSSGCGHCGRGSVGAAATSRAALTLILNIFACLMTSRRMRLGQTYVLSRRI